MAEPKYDLKGNFLPIIAGNMSNIVMEVGEPYGKVMQWIEGYVRPTRTQALKLFTYFDLSKSELSHIMAEWKYTPLTLIERNKIRLKYMNIKSRPSVSPSRVVESARATSEVRDQIDALDEKISSISEQLEKQGTGKKKGNSKNIQADINSLKETISELQESSMRMTAPVVMPEPKDMEVRLVASSSLERLEEYRSEENKWYSVLTLFVGAVLGVFVNVVTGGDLTAAAWILVGAFILMGGFAGWSAFGFQKRADSIRRKINPDGDLELEDNGSRDG